MTPLDLAAISKYLGTVCIAIGAYLYRAIDGRVEKLEEAQLNAVRQKDVDELRDDVRGLYEKMDDVKDKVIEALKR